MTHIPTLPKNNIATLKIVNFETQIQAARKRKNASGVLFPFSFFFFAVQTEPNWSVSLRLGKKPKATNAEQQSEIRGHLGAWRGGERGWRKKGRSRSWCPWLPSPLPSRPRFLSLSCFLLLLHLSFKCSCNANLLQLSSSFFPSSESSKDLLAFLALVIFCFFYEGFDAFRVLSVVFVLLLALHCKAGILCSELL